MGTAGTSHPTEMGMPDEVITAPAVVAMAATTAGIATIAEGGTIAETAEIATAVGTVTVAGIETIEGTVTGHSVVNAHIKTGADGTATIADDGTATTGGIGTAVGTTITGVEIAMTAVGPIGARHIRETSRTGVTVATAAMRIEVAATIGIAVRTAEIALMEGTVAGITGTGRRQVGAKAVAPEETIVAHVVGTAQNTA